MDSTDAVELDCPNGMPTHSKFTLAVFNAQSASRVENEDDDKFNDKKLTAALKTLPFTFKESRNGPATSNIR